MTQKIIPGKPLSIPFKASSTKALLNGQPESKSSDDMTIRFHKIKRAKTDYDKFVTQLPATPGYLILIGINKNGQELILKVFNCQHNIRSEFKQNLIFQDQSMSRIDWLNKKILQHDLKYIQAYPAHQSN